MKKQYKILGIGIVVLLLIIIFAGYLLGRAGEGDRQASVFQPSAEEADEYKGWNIFRSNEYQIEFKYPPWSNAGARVLDENNDRIKIWFEGASVKPIAMIDLLTGEASFTKLNVYEKKSKEAPIEYINRVWSPLYVSYSPDQELMNNTLPVFRIDPYQGPPEEGGEWYSAPSVLIFASSYAFGFNGTNDEGVFLQAYGLDFSKGDRQTPELVERAVKDDYLIFQSMREYTEKIYQTEKYGFSFTLPEKYDGRLVQGEAFTYNNIYYELLEIEIRHPELNEYIGTYGFAITNNKKHVLLNEWLEQVEGIDPDLVFINKKLNNISAIKLSYQSDSETKKYPVLPGGATVFEDPDHNWVIFPDFDQEHMILKYYDLGYDELENMILGSLKFE